MDKRMISDIDDCRDDSVLLMVTVLNKLSVYLFLCVCLCVCVCLQAALVLRLGLQPATGSGFARQVEPGP